MHALRQCLRGWGSSGRHRWLCTLNQASGKADDADLFGTLSPAPVIEEDDDDTVEFEPYVVLRRPAIWFGRRCEKLGRAGKIAECLAMLEQRMAEERVKPIRLNYVVVMNWLSRYGLAKRCFQLHDEMKRSSIRPSRHTYTCLLNACANSVASESQWARGKLEEVLQEATTNPRLTLDHGFYHAAIKAFARFGNVQSAFLMVDTMSAKGFSPDVVTFTHLLQACLSDKESGFSLALGVWRKMVQCGIGADTKAVNLLLRVCRDCGLGTQWNALIDCVDGKSENDGVDVSVIPSTASDGALAVVADGQSPRMAKLALLGDIGAILGNLKSSSKPDVKTLTIASDLLPNNEHYDRWLMEMVKTNRLSADVTLYNAIIRRRASRGDFDDALQLFEKVTSKKKKFGKVEENTFHCLAHGCSTPDRAYALCQKAKDMGITLSSKTCHVLVVKALRRFNFNYARNMLEYMQRNRVPATTDLLQFLEQRLGKAAANSESQSRLYHFKRFYEAWLRRVRMAPETDDRERLLDKVVSSDDLREAWEKPWTRRPVRY